MKLSKILIDLQKKGATVEFNKAGIIAIGPHGGRMKLGSKKTTDCCPREVKRIRRRIFAYGG